MRLKADLAEYSFSLRYSVVLPIPRSRAANSLSPFNWVIVLKMVCFSSSAIGNIFVIVPSTPMGMVPGALWMELGNLQPESLVQW